MTTSTPEEPKPSDRDQLFAAAKATVILIGALCLAFACIRLDRSALGIGFLLIVLFGSFVSPRMSLTLPRSKFAISFSDSLIFLAFLLYGGPGAIILSAVETLANCLYLRRSGFSWGKMMIPANVSINVIATTATYAVLIWVQSLGGSNFSPNKTQHLISLLGFLALSQFLVSSLLAAVFHSLKGHTNIWETWKKYCFSSSMTQIVGAGLAGIIFKLVNYGDLVTIAIALIAIGVAFLNYRQSISEINAAIAQVEDAERAKAETERDRRKEAERHASQLQRSLEKEELANIALRKSERDFQHAALHDSLTGLANRKKFGDALRSLIEASNGTGRSFSKCFFWIYAASRTSTTRSGIPSATRYL